MNEEKIIMQYVYLDDDGIHVYEKERALADGISDSIIEVADNYFDILNQYYTYKNGNKTRMLRLLDFGPEIKEIMLILRGKGDRLVVFYKTDYK